MSPGYRSVIFDCDSTLVTVEGIDLLAGESQSEVEALTEAAMRGEVPLEEVYGRRLELIRPSRARVRAIGDAYIASLVPGARDVVRGLIAEGVQVWIVSGGLLDPVRRVAEELGVPEDRVAAVALEYGADGGFLGFDADQHLARAGGKPKVLESWGSELARPALMVGDGMTDLEAGEVVEGFLAYAGVVDRRGVTEAASLVVRSASLHPVFSIAMGRDGPGLPDHADLYEEGVRLGWEGGDPG